MFSANLQSPLGNIRIQADENVVLEIAFAEAVDEKPNPLTEMARQQLDEYFGGVRMHFDFPIEQVGTPFQQSVWKALLTIPPGKPISYAALAKQMESLLAIRAIAAANGKNKLAIVVPCHRVIGSNGDLVGYAGELWRKKWLLAHETQMTGLGQTELF
jgi:methylated-DNA-[protein]-cysteine S-methyltransferase